MTIRTKIRWAVLIATPILLLWATHGLDRAHSAEQSQCFSLQEFKRAFEVAIPTAKQVMIHGETAKAFLEEYNSIGRPTDHEAESLLLIIAPDNGPVLVVLINEDTGCDRLILPKKLHNHIMIKIGRGAA